eukprot:EG_transcript_38257
MAHFKLAAFIDDPHTQWIHSQHLPVFFPCKAATCKHIHRFLTPAVGSVLPRSCVSASNTALYSPWLAVRRWHLAPRGWGNTFPNAGPEKMPPSRKFVAFASVIFVGSKK